MANILLVDDENELRETLAMFFELSDFKVFHAESVDQALNVYKENPIDLIISDFRMPEKTGEDLLKEIKAIAPDQKIIILTGYADTPRDSLIKLGALDLYIKPIGGKELVQIAQNILSPKEKTIDRKILLVEDDKALLESFTDIFNLKGFETTPTHQLEQAQILMKENEYDTLICDYHLGAQSAEGLIRNFTEKSPDSLVILISGDQIATEVYKKLHVNPENIHFKTKPCSVQSLIDLLRT